MQRDPAIRSVERHPPAVCLEVDRPSRHDERGDIGDRIGDQKPESVPGQVHRLIKVTGAGRIDGDQLDVGAIKIRKDRARGRLFGGGEHRRVEILAYAHRCADGGQSVGQVLRHIIGQSDLACGHGPEPTGGAPAHRRGRC